MNINPSSSPQENMIFAQALSKVLSVSRTELLARIPPKRKRIVKHLERSSSATVPVTGSVSL
jgi:hypothetical protein